MIENEDVIREFLLESYEGLERLEGDLMEYEKNPSDKAHITSIFRVVHTIKGTGAFLGYTKLETLAHAGENLLSDLRDGRIAFERSMGGVLLELVDVLRKILRSIENAQGEGSEDPAALISALKSLCSALPKEGKESVKTAPDGLAAEKPKAPSHPSPAVAEQKVPGRTAPPVSKNPLPKEGPASPAPAETPAASGGSHLEETTLRISVGLLDDLMNLTGELVLMRNQIQQFAAQRNDPDVNTATQPLNHLTAKIQEAVMKARLQPLSTLWSRFPRQVRDMAQACGKKVRLETFGGDTEIDKGLLEAIRDPLTHLMRNCVDHGIETPEERIAVGKPPEGVLTMRAFHEAGTIHMELSDDGRGIPVNKIKQKAVEQRLLAPEQADRLDPREVLKFIFLPGFSTADKVTQWSGRGVGMDVVKNNIERVGGRVDIQTQTGKGTTFQVTIPLTLAIVQALVVECGGHRLVLPRANLKELIRLRDGRSSAKIEFLRSAPVYRLRGSLLPLVFLDRELGLPPAGGDSECHIAVLRFGTRSFGLVVDHIVDFQEVVVKPLGRHLKGISLYAGSTLMGDGRPALILDVAGLALGAHVALGGETSNEAPAVETRPTSQPGKMALVFQTPDDGRMVIPMDQVVRLEVFHRSAVERAGSMDALQYEGRVLPLVHVSKILPERRVVSRNPSSAGVDDEKMQVVIYSDNGRWVGLVVDKVIDILTVGGLEAERPAGRAGVLGTLILGGRVTEMLDIPGAIRFMDTGSWKQTTEKNN